MSSRRADPFAPIAAETAAPASLPKEELRRLSAAHQFTAGTPAPSPQLPPQHRRRRTGRNTQINIKAPPETIARLLALSDRNGWVLGETLEHALAALEMSQAGHA